MLCLANDSVSTTYKRDHPALQMCYTLHTLSPGNLHPQPGLHPTPVVLHTVLSHKPSIFHPPAKTPIPTLLLHPPIVAPHPRHHNPRNSSSLIISFQASPRPASICQRSLSHHFYSLHGTTSDCVSLTSRIDQHCKAKRRCTLVLLGLNPSSG